MNRDGAIFLGLVISAVMICVTVRGVSDEWRVIAERQHRERITAAEQAALPPAAFNILDQKPALPEKND